jgi:hypothetical protein
VGGRARVQHELDELAELVDLEQACRMALQRGEQPCRGGEILATQIAVEARRIDRAFRAAPGMILAAATVGDADRLDVAAKIGRRAVPPPGDRATFY